MCCHLTVFFYYYKKSTLICMHIVEKHAMIAKKTGSQKRQTSGWDMGVPNPPRIICSFYQHDMILPFSCT